jgi:hypothetical protein
MISQEVTTPFSAIVLERNPDQEEHVPDVKPKKLSKFAQARLERE